MDSSLTKGVLNFPPLYMLKHVSGDTDVDQTAQTKIDHNGASHLDPMISPFLKKK
jgi:hypothetical protein